MNDDEQHATGEFDELGTTAVVDDADELEAQEHGVGTDHADDVHAQAEEQPQPDETLGDLDDTVDLSPEAGVADSLRTALGTMRAEADRIAALGTGQEQVEAAERFAENAGTLDEQVGSAARAADDDGRG